MASYKAILNPFTEELQLVFSGSLINIKESVTNYNGLPITGNTENDLRITQDTDKMYTWGISSATGLLTDWKDIGSISSVDWSAITNKPNLIETSTNGDWKKVTELQYNSVTEKLKVLYEE